MKTRFVLSKIIKGFYLSMVCLMLLSCNSVSNDNNLKGATKGAIGQIKPSLMVFPSDALLKRMRCLEEIDNQGSNSYVRDYKKAFINDSELKFVIASVEELFSKNGYPIENLEQLIKQIDNENAIDDMESIDKDSKTILMNTARPDFIIEIDYESRQDPSTRNPNILITYILTAIDVYTNKTVASITQPDIKNPDNKSFGALIKESLENRIGEFQGQLNTRFEDIMEKPLKVTPLGR
jgi:hypothetical protein